MQVIISKNTFFGTALVALSLLTVVNFIQIQSVKRSVQNLNLKVPTISSTIAAASANGHASHHGRSGIVSENLSTDEIAAAKKRMDPDGDGICNECGMKVEDCIEMGMLECGS